MEEEAEQQQQQRQQQQHRKVTVIVSSALRSDISIFSPVCALNCVTDVGNCGHPAGKAGKESEKLPLQQRILNSILNVSNVPYR
jgi:hypothetical protein